MPYASRPTADATAQCPRPSPSCMIRPCDRLRPLASTLACDSVPDDCGRRRHALLRLQRGCHSRALSRRSPRLSAAIPTRSTTRSRPTPRSAVVRLLRALGSLADANSVGEIDVALRAGFTPRDDRVHRRRQDRATSSSAPCTLGLKAINAESAGELDRIDAIAQAAGVRARVALRVNPDVDAQSHPHISTGLKTQQVRRAARRRRAPCCARRAARPGLEIVGVHVHIGSQMTTLDPLRSAARSASPTSPRRCSASGLAARTPRPRRRPRHPVRRHAHGAVPRRLRRVLVDVARPTGLSLDRRARPLLVGQAGVLLARVVDVKPHAGGGRVRRARRRHDRADAPRPLRRLPSHRAGANDRPGRSSLRCRRPGLREQRHVRPAARPAASLPSTI